MNPYGSGRYFADASGSVVILADGSPYFDPDTGLRNSTDAPALDDDSDEATVRQGNSPNHRGDGQNVTFPDGSTRFEKRADCGRSRDNIYTRAAAGEGTDSGGDVPEAGPDGSAPSQGPAGPKDSYLMP